MGGGLVLLPVYNDFRIRFSNVILIDERGRVVGRRRVSIADGSIEPDIVPLSTSKALAFSRTAGSNPVRISETDDAGWTWKTREGVTIPSQDNPVAVMRLDDSSLLIVYNAWRRPTDRQAGPLVIAVSDDEGRHWRPLAVLDQGRGRGMLDHYPSLVATSDGAFLMLFTRTLAVGSELRTVQFNRAWIAAQGGPPCH
jgi:hypothetical protein